MTSFEPENEQEYDLEELLREFSAEAPQEMTGESDEADEAPAREMPTWASEQGEEVPPERTIPKQWVLFGISASILLVTILVSVILILRSAQVRDLVIPTISTEESTAQTDVPSAEDSTGFSAESQAPIEAEAPIGVHKSTMRNYLLYTLDRNGNTSSVFLLGIDTQTPDVRLLSFPLDSFVYGEGDVARLGDVYGAAESGAGQQALFATIEQLVGFTLDGSIGLTQTALSTLSGQLGGISINLTSAPAYTDRTISAGAQSLSGDDFAALFRFRSGYSEIRSDSYRTVQTQALGALLQAVLQCPEQTRNGALRSFRLLAQTELSEGNLAWFAELLQEVSFAQLEAGVLTGRAIADDGRTYYELSAQSLLSALNGYFNPLSKDLKTSDLAVRTMSEQERPSLTLPTSSKKPTSSTGQTESTEPDETTEMSESTEPSETTEMTEPYDPE